MIPTHRILLIAVLAALVGACATAPEREPVDTDDEPRDTAVPSVDEVGEVDFDDREKLQAAVRQWAFEVRAAVERLESGEIDRLVLPPRPSLPEDAELRRPGEQIELIGRGLYLTQAGDVRPLPDGDELGDPSPTATGASAPELPAPGEASGAVLGREPVRLELPGIE